MAKKKQNENERTENTVERDENINEQDKDTADKKTERIADASENEKKKPESSKEPSKEAVELAEQKEKYLRLYAEYDNFRKRSQKEKDHIYSDAVVNTISELLPVFDSLEKAEQASEGSEGPLKDGITLILKQMRDTLAKLKVEIIPSSKGTAFDPNLHNAIMHENDDSIEGGAVVDDTYQKGYIKDGQVIRHALVKTRG